MSRKIEQTVYLYYYPLVSIPPPVVFQAAQNRFLGDWQSLITQIFIPTFFHA